jgi:DNA-binding MarR family transcriptional regulator
MTPIKKKAAKPAQKLGEPLDFLRTIWALDHQLQTASRRMESQIGVTGPQRFVLRIVHLQPGITPGEVAKTLHVHPSTLTGVLQRLEKRRLLNRKADAGDARRVHLQLTDAGSKVAASTAGTIEDAVRLALQKVPKARVEHARSLLEGLTTTLETLKTPGARAR